MKRGLGSLIAMAVLVGGVLSLGHLPATAAQGDAGGAEAHPLVGSWMVTLTFESTTPAIVNHLTTFAADGTMLVATTGELPTIPAAGGDILFSEGHGAWEAAGEQTGDATFKFFMVDPSGGVFSTTTVNMTLDADPSGDTYSGEFTLDSVSPDGAEMGDGRGTVDATRIEVEPMASPMAATPAT